jgi:hypothetical protein
MRYVGGVVKWTVEKIWAGVGCFTTNAAWAGASGILFVGNLQADTGNPSVPFYWFDGVNAPVLVNPLTEIYSVGPANYCVTKDCFTVWNGNTMYYFDPVSQAWGKNTAPFGSIPGIVVVPVQNDGAISTSRTGRGWAKTAANRLGFYYSTGSNVGSGYVQTTMMGSVEYKTLFDRVTPILRRLVDAGAQFASIFRTRITSLASSWDSRTTTSK